MPRLDKCQSTGAAECRQESSRCWTWARSSCIQKTKTHEKSNVASLVTNNNGSRDQHHQHAPKKVAYAFTTKANISHADLSQVVSTQLEIVITVQNEMAHLSTG